MQKNIKYSLYTECISMILKEYTECISMILGGFTQGKVLLNCTYNSAGGVAFWGWGSRGVHGLFLVKKVLFADNNVTYFT